MTYIYISYTASYRHQSLWFSTKPPWNVSSWCEVTSPPTRGCLKMYIDCGSTSGSRVMKPTAIFCAKKTVFSELVLEGEWSDHPKWESTHRQHFFFFQEVFWTPSQLFLKHPNIQTTPFWAGTSSISWFTYVHGLRVAAKLQGLSNPTPPPALRSVKAGNLKDISVSMSKMTRNSISIFNFLQMHIWAHFASHQLQPCWTGCTLERPGP